MENVVNEKIEVNFKGLVDDNSELPESVTPGNVEKENSEILKMSVNGVEEEMPLDTNLMEEIRNNMPEEFKDITDEDITRMLNNGMQPEDESLKRSEQLVRCFGDEYQEVFNVVADKIYEISEVMDEDNARRIFLEHTLEYTNAILNYEKEDREEETSIPGILEGSELLKYKSRVIDLIRLSYKHFVYFICNIGQGNLAYHNKDELINNLIWDVYADTLNVQLLVTDMKTKLQNMPHSETRYFDPIITNNNSISHILATVAWLTNDLVDLLVAEKVENDEEVTLKDRNEAFISIFKEIL